MPLLLIAVARDRDESSTDPWLSFTVFSHSKFRAESCYWDRSRKQAGVSSHFPLPPSTSALAGVQLPHTPPPALMLCLCALSRSWGPVTQHIFSHASTAFREALAGRCRGIGFICCEWGTATHPLQRAYHPHSEISKRVAWSPRLVLFCFVF